VAETFWFEMQERNLFDRFQVTNTGCFGPCGLGPNVLVYPDGVLYVGVKKEDVATLIEEHLLGGKPLERLLAPADVWS
jgi:(2Fe-2S) ferredoxin